MREQMFPRWASALFALIPLGEMLYAPVTAQTVYAAALASLLCAAICAGAGRLAPLWQQHRFLQWLLAAFSLWPLASTLGRMSVFLQQTVFPNRPIWIFVLLLCASALLIATIGLNRNAMWALPVAWTAALLALISTVLTVQQVHPTYWEAPTLSVLQETESLVRSMLPAALALSLTLPDPLSGAAARSLSAGGAIFALLSLRTLLVLGPHTAALLPYPGYSAAGLAAIGDFARHGEVFFAVPLLLCDLGRAAALACVVLMPLTQSCGVMQRRDHRT